MQPAATDRLVDRNLSREVRRALDLGQLLGCDTQRFRQLLIVGSAPKVAGEIAHRPLVVPGAFAGAARYPVAGAQLVDHRTPDAHHRVGRKGIVASRVEAIEGVHQADHAGMEQVIAVDIGRQVSANPVDHGVDQRQVAEDLGLAMLLDIPVELTVELGRTRMPIHEMLKLRPGSAVKLARLEGEPVDILANDVLIARGEVVVRHEKYGIRITEITSRMERLKGLR